MIGSIVIISGRSRIDAQLAAAAAAAYSQSVVGSLRNFIVGVRVAEFDDWSGGWSRAVAYNGPPNTLL